MGFLMLSTHLDCLSNTPAILQAVITDGYRRWEKTPVLQLKSEALVCLQATGLQARIQTSAGS